MGTQRPTAQVVRRDSSGLALSRYPIQAASYMLPGFGESPRLGFQALCAIARWLGSRHEQTSVCECLGDAAWIPERSATRLREADLNVLSKLGKQGLEWRLEPEAFAG